MSEHTPGSMKISEEWDEDSIGVWAEPVTAKEAVDAFAKLARFWVDHGDMGNIRARAVESPETIGDHINAGLGFLWHLVIPFHLNHEWERDCDGNRRALIEEDGVGIRPSPDLLEACRELSAFLRTELGGPDLPFPLPRAPDNPHTRELRTLVDRAEAAIAKAECRHPCTNSNKEP